MTPEILYLALTETAAETIGRRYPREIVMAKPLASIMGHRGRVVVVEPIRPDASQAERDRYEQLIDHARTKVRTLGVPLIVGELI